MQNHPVALCGVCILSLLLGVGLAEAAQPIQVVSAVLPGSHAQESGNGDSFGPILSPDGRYVLFASMANNLTTVSNGTAMSSPLKVNVFLRDRVARTTTLVSANSEGRGGNGGSFPLDLSADGRCVVFQSNANDLTPGDTNRSDDIFLRDVVSGTNCAVSIGADGVAANGASRSASITPDGRWVAFASAASNLVPGDTNNIVDVFVRDMVSGSNILVSAGAISAGSVLKYTRSSSESPAISADGRYVAFFSTATNVIPGVQTVADIYVRDLATGAAWCASAGAREALQAVLGTNSGVCYNHALSADGQFVAYEVSRAPGAGDASPGLILRFSLSTGQTDIIHTNAYVPPVPYEDIHNLDLTPDGRFVAFVANTNGTSGKTTCAYVWDAQAAASVLVSGNLSNDVPVESMCDRPVISADGRFVVFLSSSTNLVTNSLAGDFHVYCRDLVQGSTVLLDADSDGVGSPINPETALALSADGRIAAFECAEGRLVASNREMRSNVIIRDALTGDCEVASAAASGRSSSTPNGPSFISPFSLSADARYIAYASDADDLSPHDTNVCRDIFVRDLAFGTNILVSVAHDNTSADGGSTEPAISGDGQVVAFTSAADNLVPGDTNKTSDVFVRFLSTGTTVLVSANKTASGPGNGASYSPSLSSDGRYVLYVSRATDLAARSVYATPNLFLRDLQMNVNYALTTNKVISASMTPDGRFVCCSGAGGVLYLWDTLLTIQTRLLSSNDLNQVSISPNGRRIAFSASSGLHLLDVAARKTAYICPAVSGSHPGLRFSQDERWLVHTRVVSFTNQVYLFDCLNNSDFLVSHRYGGLEPAFGPSDWPEISPDGRTIVYRSVATNLLSGIIDPIPRLIWYDRETGSNTLMCSSTGNDGLPSNRSLCPVFSADGQRLVLQSWASEFAGNDLNQSSDAFVLVFPRVSISPGNGSEPGAQLSWTSFPNAQYRVQFKNDLSETNWTDLSGEVTNSNGQAWFFDSSPGSVRRFYRIVSY